MKIYFGAFVGALFLMLFVGIIAESFVWMAFDFFHASKTVLITAEGVMVLPLLVMFAFVFRHTLKIERDLAEQGY